MMMSIASSITTAKALLDAGDIGRCELVRGELRMMTPASARHGWFANEIAFRLNEHVRKRGLGQVFAAKTGSLLTRNPDTVRAPDAAFVVKDRLAQIPLRGYFPGAPDLAVEVLSPDDTASEVLEKVNDWLSSGTRQVWIVDPQHQTISIHRADRPVKTFRADDELTENELLDGFSLRVNMIFR